MAARRLIIVLLVLFGISVVAAAIAPDRKGGGIFDRSGSDSTSSGSTTATTTSPSVPPPNTAGETLTARIDASAKQPETVEGFVGDQLELHVGSEESRVVTIEEFGLTEVAAPEAPADFDLLLRDAGRFAITDIETDEIVGRLVVRAPSAGIR